jgi:hypothetical protein
MCESKILITSQPKAGTYLVAKIFELLGFTNSNIHLHRDLSQYWQYTGNAEYDRNTNPGNIAAHLPIHQVLDKVVPGGFLVGHLPGTDHVRDVFDGWKKIILLRDHPGCMASMYRWRMKSGRTHGESYAALPYSAEGFAKYLDTAAHNDTRNWAEFMKSWREGDGIFVYFDLLIRGFVDYELFRLHFGIDRQELDMAIQDALASDTQTKIPHDSTDLWTRQNREAATRLRMAAL